MRPLHAPPEIPRLRAHCPGPPSRSLTRGLVVQVWAAADEKDYKASVAAMSHATSMIDKNVKRGIVHKNTAARRKSRMAFRVKELEPKSE